MSNLKGYMKCTANFNEVSLLGKKSAIKQLRHERGNFEQLMIITSKIEITKTLRHFRDARRG
jgi:hypothetical protein